MYSVLITALTAISGLNSMSGRNGLSWQKANNDKHQILHCIYRQLYTYTLWVTYIYKCNNTEIVDFNQQ